MSTSVCSFAESKDELSVGSSDVTAVLPPLAKSRYSEDGEEGWRRLHNRKVWSIYPELVTRPSGLMREGSIHLALFTRLFSCMVPVLAPTWSMHPALITRPSGLVREEYSSCIVHTTVFLHGA